jgi:hypothetical protein
MARRSFDPAKRFCLNHSPRIRSAGAPLARALAMIVSSNSIAVWTRAAGVMIYRVG